jgi:hypothetical protein
MKKIINHYRYLLVGVLFVMVSCQKMSYDQQFSSTYPLNGEWTVTYEVGGTTDGPHNLLVYNTSLSKDSIWLEDKVYWPFKFKAKANMTDNSFTTTNAPSSIVVSNSTYTDVCNITVGKIVNKDSIYIEMEFVDGDPGTPYKVYGHRKTSYEEYMGL